MTRKIAVEVPDLCPDCMRVRDGWDWCDVFGRPIKKNFKPSAACLKAIVKEK